MVRYALVRSTDRFYSRRASTRCGLWRVHVQFAMSEAEVDSPEKRRAILTPYCLLPSILDHVSQKTLRNCTWTGIYHTILMNLSEPDRLHWMISIWRSLCNNGCPQQVLKPGDGAQRKDGLGEELLRRGAEARGDERAGIIGHARNNM